MIILFKVHKLGSLVSFQWDVLAHSYHFFAAELYHISEKGLSKLKLISYFLALSFKVDLFIG